MVFLLIVIFIVCLLVIPEITIVAVLLGLAVYFWQVALIILAVVGVCFIPYAIVCAIFRKRQ